MPKNIFKAQKSVLKCALQVLPDNSCDDAQRNTPGFVNAGDGKGYIVFLPRCAAVITGMGDGIDTVGQPDIDRALMHVGDLACIFALYPDET